VPAALLKRARLSLGVIPSGTNGHTSWRLATTDSAIPRDRLEPSEGNASNGSMGLTSSPRENHLDPCTGNRPRRTSSRTATRALREGHARSRPRRRRGFCKSSRSGGILSKSRSKRTLDGVGAHVDRSKPQSPSVEIPRRRDATRRKRCRTT
jgi:hypothetical protein